jgi:hypothetical protein
MRYSSSKVGGSSRRSLSPTVRHGVDEVLRSRVGEWREHPYTPLKRSEDENVDEQTK